MSDFGEPWVVAIRSYDHEEVIASGNSVIGGLHGGMRLTPNAKVRERMVACVNACAGLADPAAEIAALRGQVAILEQSFADVCAALGCARDNEAALLAVHALRERCARLETNLKLIAKMGGMTLKAPSLGPDGDRGHQIGANKAFEQAADIARAALREGDLDG